MKKRTGADAFGPGFPDGAGNKNANILYQGKTLKAGWRMLPTEEEKERACKFRRMLADLSPDVYGAYLALTGGEERFLPIAEAEIDIKLGPILQKYGFDVKELALHKNRRERAGKESTKRVEACGPVVVDVDFTKENYLSEFQTTLEMILHSKRVNNGWKPFCIAIPSKVRSVGTACIAPLSDWKKVGNRSLGKDLSDRIERAYKGLAKAAVIKTDFDRCQVVYFNSGEDDVANAWAQNVNCTSQFSQSPHDDVGGNPLVLVDGKMVVAALPRDEGNRVIAATVAVEEGERSSIAPENSFLPSVADFMAYATRGRDIRSYAS